MSEARIAVVDQLSLKHMASSGYNLLMSVDMGQQCLANGVMCGETSALLPLAWWVAAFLASGVVLTGCIV